MKNSRRAFNKTNNTCRSRILAANTGWTAKSYSRITGANDRVRVGVVGFPTVTEARTFPAL